MVRTGVAILTAIASLGAEAADLNGLSGEKLLDAVSASCRPTTLMTTAASPGGVWEAFRQTDAKSDGTINNRFSAEIATFPQDGYSAPTTMEIVTVVAPEWWGLAMADAPAQGRDLHNLLPAPVGTGEYKRNYPPGQVVTAVYDNGAWKAGVGLIGGVEVNMYQPPTGYEGDFARTIMYMVAAYRCDFWQNLGENFMVDSYPVLQPWAARQLMAWHHSDPVSDEERQRNEAVARLQGNHNPFVADAAIADYIWGEKAGEPYRDDASERTPLRGVYSLTDKRIDLYSPYIAEGAQWNVDGRTVDSEYLVPANLGIGTHELRWRTASVAGKLKIEIR